jgi:PAS domain S-box-containing protein
MKLTPRLAIYFVLYAATLLVAVSSLAYTSGLASLQAATISELSSSAIEKQSALNQWIEDKQSGIALLAADPAAIASASALVSAPAGSPEAQAAHDQFVREVQPRVNGGEFLTIILIDSQTGAVIAATDPNEEGTFKEDRLYFMHGKTDPYVQNVYYALAVQGPAMTAAAPLRGSGGERLAVLAGRLDLEEMNAIINRRSGLRQSDDAYLVNTSNLFITQPYLVPDPAVLLRGVHTPAVNQCLTQRTSGMLEAEDYRGVPAVIVYRWLPERELCLIVKMDQAEAYASIRKFGGTVAVISVLALLVGALWAIALARNLTRPILALQAGAARFGEGELNVRLPETTRDELGMLAHEFNQMAASLLAKDAELRAYAQTLEQKVQERTRELRESHARLEKVLEVETVGVMFWDLTTGCMTDANDAFLNLMGYSRGEVEARELTWQKLTPPEYVEASLAEIRKFQETGRVGPYEKEYFRKDGTRQWLVFAGSALGSNTCVEFCVDISDRKRAEERFRLVVESVPNSIVMVDGGGRILLVNVQTEKLFGYSRSELIGQSVDVLVPDRYREGHAGHRALFLEHPSARPMGAGRDLFGVRKDGSEFPVEIGLSPIETEGGSMVLASIVDITERKRAEAALRESEEKYAIIFEKSPFAITLTRMPQGTLVGANDAFLELFGFTQDEVIGRTSMQLGITDTESRAKVAAEFQARGYIRDFEVARRTATGRHLDLALSLDWVPIGGEKYVLTTIRDITERKRAEEGLRKSEQQFSVIFEKAPFAASLSTLPGGVIKEINEAFEKLFGYSRLEAIGRTSLELGMYPDPAARQRAAEEIRKRGFGRDVEMRLRTKSGEVRDFLTNTDFVEIGDEKHVLTTAQDITDRKLTAEALQKKNEELKAMSQQLWQAAKLATMGELAASIAHELNNPLATVSLRAEILQARFSPDDPQSRSLQVIDSEIKRMSSLVANLLQVSRRSASQLSTINVNEELADTLELIQYHLRKYSIRIVQELSPELPLIQADRQQLRQVFLNLFTNAADAMPLGGLLTIRTWSGEKPEVGTTRPLRRTANQSLGLPVSGVPQIFIEVSDTGEGIPADRLERVWEPFYTTKPEGKGTGLGLAICRRIVQEHGGTIELISEGIPGKGTTIRLALSAMKER